MIQNLKQFNAMVINQCKVSLEIFFKFLSNFITYDSTSCFQFSIWQHYHYHLVFILPQKHNFHQKCIFIYFSPRAYLPLKRNSTSCSNGTELLHFANTITALELSLSRSVIFIPFFPTQLVHLKCSVYL